MGMGLRIKTALRKQKMSIKQLSEKTGISINTLYSITKRDSKKVDPVILQIISEELNLELCENKDEKSMLCMDFYREMKEHCIRMNAECENCCMRLYCYTPPCEKTDSMMANVISFLATAQSCTGNENHSDHCTGAVQMPCPCNMDMSTALGYEPRQ